MSVHNTFQSMNDIAKDHAGTHHSTAGQHEQVDPALTDGEVKTILKQGFVVMEGLFPPEQLAAIRSASAPLLTRTGRNDLEGLKTKRVYSVFAKTQSCTPLAEHPRILCLLDRLLLPNYLLSMFQIIEIHPGEKAQFLHHDDAFYPLPRPRPAVSVASILAVDDFTPENGATSYIPGSHCWGDDRQPTEDDERVPMVMSAGSVAVFLGTLWHGGGANNTEHARLAVTCQYCEPWARTQENMFLAVPGELIREASSNMQRMLGYSIYAPFMGNVNGLSPLRVLTS